MRGKNVRKGVRRFARTCVQSVKRICLAEHHALGFHSVHNSALFLSPWKLHRIISLQGKMLLCDGYNKACVFNMSYTTEKCHTNA